jgi:hypothetical protein
MHHSPDRSDEAIDVIVELARLEFENTAAARERLVIEL